MIYGFSSESSFAIVKIADLEPVPCGVKESVNVWFPVAGIVLVESVVEKSAAFVPVKVVPETVNT